MTEKRFRVQEHCLRSSYGIEAENWLVTNDNRCVVLTNKSEAHMVANMLNDVIDKLNELNDKKDELKRNYDLCVHRRMNDHNEIHRLEKENKELKDLLKSMADRNNEIWLDNGQIIRLKKVFKGEWTND